MVIKILIMAQIKIEDIVDNLSSEFRRALEDTIKEHFPKITFDSYYVFRTFNRKISSKCSTWENVPDRYIQLDN